jgi:phosphonate transport system substrate-binding protein
VTALNFAVVSGRADAGAQLSTLCSELERALSRPVIPRVLPSYVALRQDVEAGLAQIAWAPPKIAIELEDEGLATIDLCCLRGGTAAYHAAIFTRHASPIETLADLRGRHAAWVDAESTAGYLLPRVRLAEEGLDPDALFGKESFLGTHARVAVAVLSGEADVGATYLSLDPVTGRPVSAGWLDAGAGINGALVLAAVGPIPSDTIVLSKSIPANEKGDLVDKVLGLPASQPVAVGRLLGAEGFVSARPSHFEALRGLLKASPKAEPKRG